MKFNSKYHQAAYGPDDVAATSETFLTQLLGGDVPLRQKDRIRGEILAMGVGERKQVVQRLCRGQAETTEVWRVA